MSTTMAAKDDSQENSTTSIDILRSSGNVAKILANRRTNEHSPPTRDGQVSLSSDSNLSSAKDLLNKHQANISRLAQAFGLPN